MVSFATEETIGIVRQMWKTCFGDSDEFLDMFFSRVSRPENTLIYFEEEAAASLQMIPYTITFYGEEITFYYLAGLCTLPQHRKKGYMAHLIHRAHEVMGERGISMSILIPAEGWLFDFYQKYEYEQVFEQDSVAIVSLKNLMDAAPCIEDAYQDFDKIYRSVDFCVQKTFQDFETIIIDARADDYPTKTNLSAMAYLGNVQYLLSLYAKANPQTTFTIRVNNDVYKIDEGICVVEEPSVIDFKVSKRELCRLLFGYKTNELSEEYRLFFPERKPIINLMLE